MAHRIPLQPNTLLHLSNENGEALRFVIEREIGRGGSCIVYEASRRTETGDKTLYRIKEYYPYKLNITRDKHNYLIPSDQSKEIFQRGQEQLYSLFAQTNHLFYSEQNYSSMTNQMDLFRQNGTIYTLSTYSSDKTLALYQPKTLKECIGIVRQTAYVLGKLHQQGYLYLDMKPDNVLIVDGYHTQIQLFDFDTLLSLQNLDQMRTSGGGCVKLSYTQGFAPIELQTMKIKRLGFHSDVFGVGALCFFLLFGRTPNALDCESDTEYPFAEMVYHEYGYDDRVFDKLTDFFHHSLASYYADRYPSMQDVLETLSEIERFADSTIPRLFSSRLMKPRNFFGRESELTAFHQRVNDNDCSCLLLTGMGGIGKSTFIRAYLYRYQHQFDTVLYLSYQGSIEATITNDRYLEINTLKQDEATKGNTRYFEKKLQKLRELVRGTKSILVIDNFSGEADEDLKAVLETGLKVILVSRRALSCQQYQEYHLSAISDLTALQQLFESSVGHLIETDERADFEQIAQNVRGHTLVLELIAKQIANSHITLSRAAELVESVGFSSIAAEKVAYERDYSASNDTIGSIIDTLFSASQLSDNRKALMKIFSLVGDEGMNLRQFHEIMNLPSLDDANELIQGGWLMLNQDTLSMHQVIQEAVHRWGWSEEWITAAERFLCYFYLEIRLEATKNNYPLKRYKIHTDMHQARQRTDFLTKTVNKWCESFYQQKGIVGTVAKERFARSVDVSHADMEKLISLLSLSEKIIRKCKKEVALKERDAYVNLLYVTVLYTPQYNEQFILSEMQGIFAQNYVNCILNGAKELWKDEDIRNPITIIQLYALAVIVHAENGRLDEAEALIGQAERLAKKVKHRRVYALYYNLLSEYYDILLGGMYDTDNPEEILLRDKMLNCIEKTLKYSQKYRKEDDKHLYAVNLLSKATILMRSGMDGEKEVAHLIQQAKKVIEENTLPYADVRLRYWLVCGWYHTLKTGQMESVCFSMRQAKKLSDCITPTDLRRIEDIYIPFANMFFEMARYKEAITLL